MAPQNYPESYIPVELPGQSVVWWSEPITVGVLVPISEFKLAVVTYRGWNRKVRVSLILDGQIQPPVTYLMLDSMLQIRLAEFAELGPTIPYSSFSPCALLEFHFNQGPEDTFGRPRVIIHTKTPIFKIQSSVPRPPFWTLVVNYLRHRFLESRGNELQIMIHP
ncbi:hypothetical protein VTL71DRAFT_6713 [Oculimacula yallundae]|uniref:Uncharacterized protein n=1 Tax=Oculimacula yallundae TaxID=86028 RepID=A0ABR4BYN2_9HELO